MDIDCSVYCVIFRYVFKLFDRYASNVLQSKRLTQIFKEGVQLILLREGVLRDEQTKIVYNS